MVTDVRVSTAELGAKVPAFAGHQPLLAQLTSLQRGDLQLGRLLP